MVTLANVNPRSLAIDLGQFGQRFQESFTAFQTAEREEKRLKLLETKLAAEETAREAEARRQADITANIETVVSADKTPLDKARTRLAFLDPQGARTLADLAREGTEEQREAFNFKVENDLKLAEFVLRQKDPAGRQRALTRIASDAVSRGEAPEPFIELMNMQDDDLLLELQRMKVVGTDKKTLLAPRFEGIVDPITGLTAQRNLSTGQLTTDPFQTAATAQAGQQSTAETARLNRLSREGIAERRLKGEGGAKRVSEIGKINQAVRDGEMTQQQGDILTAGIIRTAQRAGRAPTDAEKAQSPIGKILADRRKAIKRFGADSAEVAAFDAQIEGLVSDEKVTPGSPLGKLISDRESAIAQFGANSPQVAAFDAAIASDEKGDKPKFSDVAGLRKEFTKQSGDFITMRNAVKKVNAAAATPSAAGDIALIFNFMKILDPGSVVRESEFATAANAGGIPDRVRAQYNRALRGERLSERQRQDFVDTSTRVFETQLDSQRKLETSFRDIATNQGFDPNNVVINFVDEPLAAAPAEQVARPVGSIITNSKGQRGRVEADGSITPIE